MLPTLEFITWYLIIQVISLLILPFSWSIFSNLPDRGYAFSKSLGVLLVGFILWMGTTLNLMSNNSSHAWLALAILGLSSFIFNRKIFHRNNQGVYTILEWLKSNLSLVVVCELIFLIGFAFWSIVRAHDPGVNHTEQPMDLMFMNGIWTSSTYPPHDPWLQGFPIGYYYFGYWLLTILGRLACIGPNIAYNLGQASWFGLFLLGTFGISYNLLALNDDNDEKRTTKGRSFFIWGGFFMAFVVVFAGNLKSFFDSIARIENNTNWWWWQSSRVIQDSNLLGRPVEIINEFPIFSFILGDNHPHLLAIPFVLLVIGLSLNLFISKYSNNTDPTKIDQKHSHVWSYLTFRYRQLLKVVPFGGIGFAIICITSGAIILLNTWDFPGCFLIITISLFFALLGLKEGEKNEHGRFLSKAAVTTALFVIVSLVFIIIIYFPYLITAQSQFLGFLPNLLNPTDFLQFFLVIGPFLIGIVILLCHALNIIDLFKKGFFISIFLVFALPLVYLGATILLGIWTDSLEFVENSFFTNHADFNEYLITSLTRRIKHPITFIVVGMLIASTWSALWKNEQQRSIGKKYSPGLSFSLILAGIGLFMVYVPEFIYIHDLFSNRMNTVFKFYYLAWPLLGISSLFAIVEGLKGYRYGYIMVSTTCAFLIILGLIYPVIAIYDKTHGFSLKIPNFSTMAHLKTDSPDELAAILWVKNNTKPDALIVEGEGESYNAKSNRISTFTGRKTLLGWEGHERQWRGKSYWKMAKSRAQDLKEIYNPVSTKRLEQILTKWKVDHVYLGPWEMGKYNITPTHERLLFKAMDLSFKRKSVRIYKKRDS